ncbi:hypothetical protein K6U06_06450 [Acidiferrimicrobium sp. IK]|uniref:hypothetical protein n=1 Tax=Acidiferrimicrobium sp. IK TaxID=2871700 RepID=UPI0021CB74E2|nr:hypothetical protein [Acidiferrimicrobium sp. IK]MCU4183993.1 hypothetical protein [Acidiferrimicrobium sp. IK]
MATVVEMLGEACAHADPFTTDQEIAQAVLADLGGVSRRAAEALLPLVSNAVCTCRRQLAAAAEARAFRSERVASRSGREVVVSAGGYEPDITALRQVLAVSFKVAGETVLWGAATLAQHRDRITEQRARADGIEQDIARHEQAIALIERAGVSCLAEVLDAKAQVAA